MIDNFLEKSNIPISCEVNSTIFKKLFYENGSMNKTDKDIFAKDIDKIRWLYSFKENTINIRSYKDDEREYVEIAVIEVILENDSKVKKISEIIQRTIPYPLILIFKYKDKLLINVAHKRVNKSDESKNTVEEFIYTDWIDFQNISDREEQFFSAMNIKKFSFSNFYRFYTDIVDRINVFNASKYQGNYKSLTDKDAREVKMITDKIENIDIQILELKSKIKKEFQFNEKIKMNIQIKKLESTKDGLIEKLNN